MTDPSQYFKGRTVQEQMNEVIGYVDTRSVEVATDAIAADVAQVHSDAADAHADALAAAASAASAAGTLANAVKKTGEASQSIAGDIAVAGALSGGSIATSGAATFSGTTTVPTPVNNTDAATKKYVDDADALLVPIADINQHAVGLTGNQGPIGGYKEFVDIRAAGSIPAGSVTSSVTGYACVLKIPHTKNTTIRQHILLWCTARQRDDPGAILAIYSNNGTALGLSIMVSPQGTPRTYTLTDDGDNLYLWLTGTNSNNDLLQTTVIARTEFGSLSVEYMNNVIESSLLGNVVKTVTVGL